MGIRTDLAMEERELRQKEDGIEPDGVQVHEWDKLGIHVTEIHIGSQNGAEALHKPMGNYLTMEVEAEQLRCAPNDCAELMAELLCGLIPKGAVLVVGLGNEAVTPDAVGPLALKRTLVTRHLRDTLPELFGAFRQVSAVPTGVLGNTGIESAEIVRGVVERTRPDCVIAIDALASARPERLCRSIQISDAGIVPGSGIRNNRAALNRETLQVPVISIGVPTVCDLRSLMETDEEMIVTPGKIDAQVGDLARIIGMGMNRAFHPSIAPEDLAEFVGGL